MGGDVFAAFQVGDGTGDFQDAVVSPHGHAQTVEGLPGQGPGFVIQGAELLYLAGSHLGIGEDFGAPEAFGLDGAGRFNPLPYNGAALRHSLGFDNGVFQARYLDLDIYTV